MKLLQEAKSELNAVFGRFFPPKAMVILAILGKPVADIGDYSFKNNVAATINRCLVVTMVLNLLVS
jgi:hypothetical protein